MAYKLVWKNDGVEMIYSGVLTDMDIIASNIEVVSSQNFRDIKFVISDLQQLTSFPIKSETIEQIAKIDSNASIFNPNVQVAIVGSTIIAHGIAKMYQNYSHDSEWTTEFFKDKSSAQRWIKKHNHTQKSLCH